MPDINWTDIPATTTTLVGSTLTKTSGSAGTPNAGGISQVLSGDFSVQLMVPSATAKVYVGLDPAASLVTDFTQLNHLMMVVETGNVSYRENGSYLGELPSANRGANALLKLVRVGSTIKCQVNSEAEFTFPTPDAADIRLHVLLLDVGNSVTDGVVTSGGGGTIATLPAPAAITQTSAPVSYPNAIAHKSPLPPPEVIPAAPARGGVYLDPVFNTYWRRGTDGNTGTLPARLNRSHRLNSSAPTCIWSRDDAYIIGTTPSGAIELYSVDTSFDDATRASLTHIRDLTFNSEPTFSRVTAGRIFGVVGFKIREHNVAANTYADLMDLAVIDSAYTTGGKVLGGSVQSSMSNPERIVCFYGGTAQDTHKRALVFDKGDPSNGLIIDTQARTIAHASTPADGVSVPGMDDFWIHSVAIDLSGQYVLLNSTQQPGDAITYIWDTANGTVFPATGALHANGHSMAGWKKWFNNESFGDSPYFAYQIVKRSLADPATYSKVFGPPSFTDQVYSDSHYASENQRSDVQTPIFGCAYRYYEDIPENLNTGGFRGNTKSYKALDNEVFAIHPDTGEVYRFGHTYADVYADDGTGASGFWYQPMVHPSPSGRFIARSSNHMKTLGLDPTVGEPQTLYRADIDICDTAWVPSEVVFTPPTVSLTSPLEGATSVVPGAFTLTATASDADGSIAHVTFYAGDRLIGRVATAPYTYAWTNVGAGSFAITAVAEDNDGNKTTSNTRHVSVTPIPFVQSAQTVAVQGQQMSGPPSPSPDVTIAAVYDHVVIVTDVVGQFVDLSTASEITFVFRSPSGVISTKAGSQMAFYAGDDEEMAAAVAAGAVAHYVTDTDDLTTPGTWRSQCKIVIAGVTMYTEPKPFTVG